MLGLNVNAAVGLLGGGLTAVYTVRACSLARTTQRSSEVRRVMDRTDIDEDIERLGVTVRTGSADLVQENTADGIMENLGREVKRHAGGLQTVAKTAYEELNEQLSQDGYSVDQMAHILSTVETLHNALDEKLDVLNPCPR